MSILKRTSAEVAYHKGAIVVCYACGVPLYRLNANIWMGEPTSKTGWKYSPVSIADLEAIVHRQDLDPGIRAAVKFWTKEQAHAHCESIPTLRNGELPPCPSCKGQFARADLGRTEDDKARFIDRSYVVSLATIEPEGKARPITMAGHLQNSGSTRH